MGKNDNLISSFQNIEDFLPKEDPIESPGDDEKERSETPKKSRGSSSGRRGKRAKDSEDEGGHIVVKLKRGIVSRIDILRTAESLAGGDSLSRSEMISRLLDDYVNSHDTKAIRGYKAFISQ